MEAVNRQSAIHSLMNRDHYYSAPTKIHEKEHQIPRSAGQTIVHPNAISPTTLYPNHPPPPYSHSNSVPLTNQSGLMSPQESNPSESRRTSGDAKDPGAAHRQSLPSIHEALNPPSSFAHPRISVNSLSTRPYGTFTQHPPTPTSRESPMDSALYHSQTYPGQSQSASPPHPIHPLPSYARGDPMGPSFETRHTPLPSIRTGPLPQQSSHLPAGAEYPRYEPDLRNVAPVQNGYSHQSSRNGSYPNSHAVPNHPSPAFSPQSPYPPQRPYHSRYENEEHPKVGENPATQKIYGPVVKRHLDYWDIEIELNNMKTSGNEIARVSSNLLAEAQRNTHHGSIPERIPLLHEIDSMRKENEKLSAAIARVTERVVMQGQFLGEQPSAAPVATMEEYPPEEMNWDAGMGGYGVSDAKKRRGRAAPPGRCHSCNRAETPEWRRGPDGARTLCNACGLHYAKLTRKLGSKQGQNASSSHRPSSAGEVSPRS